MADLYPAFVFLLLPLCHLLRYERLGSLGAVGVLPACSWSARRGGALRFASIAMLCEDTRAKLLRGDHGKNIIKKSNLFKKKHFFFVYCSS